MNIHPIPQPCPGPCAALLASLLSTLLLACTGAPTAHEQSLGDSVRQAQVQQSVQPPGTPVTRGEIVTDGVAAAHGLDRYHQSFARPQAPISVLNIQAGGGAQTMPAMPR